MDDEVPGVKPLKEQRAEKGRAVAGDQPVGTVAWI